MNAGSNRGTAHLDTTTRPARDSLSPGPPGEDSLSPRPGTGERVKERGFQKRATNRWNGPLCPALSTNRPTAVPSSEGYLFSAMVGMARCAVPARVVAGGTNFRVTLAIEGVAPLHAARTSQRDVPTPLSRYPLVGEREEVKGRSS